MGKSLDEIDMDAIEFLPRMAYKNDYHSPYSCTELSYVRLNGDEHSFHMFISNDIAWFLTDNLIHDDQRLNMIETGYGDHYPYPYLFTLREKNYQNYVKNPYSLKTNNLKFVGMYEQLPFYMYFYDNMHDLWNALTDIEKLPRQRPEMIDKIKNLGICYEKDYIARNYLNKYPESECVNRARYMLKIAKPALGEEAFKVFQKTIRHELKELIRRIGSYIDIRTTSPDKWTDHQKEIVVSIERLVKNESISHITNSDFKIVACSGYILDKLHGMNPFACPYDDSIPGIKSWELYPQHGENEKRILTNYLYYVCSYPKFPCTKYGQYTYSYTRSNARKLLEDLGYEALEDYSTGPMPLVKGIVYFAREHFSDESRLRGHHEKIEQGIIMKSKERGFIKKSKDGTFTIDREKIEIALYVSAALTHIRAYQQEKNLTKERAELEKKGIKYPYSMRGMNGFDNQIRSFYGNKH